MGAVTTTCLVHDDRPQARRRLEALVRSVAGVDAVLAARDADDLLQRVVACPGAMVVVGLADAAPTGVETVRRVLGCAPGAAVLVAGSADVSGPAQDALAEGAIGFLRWDAPRAMIRMLVRTGVSAAAGDALVPTVGAAATTEDDAAIPGLREVRIDVAVQRRLELSVREIQVLIGVGRGFTNADIGRRLYLSGHTIKTHTGHLFRKLGAADRAQAVHHAWRSGLFV